MAEVKGAILAEVKGVYATEVVLARTTLYEVAPRANASASHGVL